jgi:ankyrin repeat protein
MKQLFLVIATVSASMLHAQQNSFLDPTFWKNNPNLTTVKAEIEKGNNPAELNRSSFDPVVFAINNRASNEVIKYMLEQKGNDIDKLTHDARTYIFWAASQGNVEIVEYLVNKGAKANLEDSHGSTPISMAASAGQSNPKLYDALVKAGGNLKQKNRDGASLVLLGIANDKELALTNYLITKGLSLKDTDAEGNTAFNYVARTGNIALLKTLLEKGVKYTDNAIIMATQGSRGGAANGLEVFEYLESLGIKPNAVNKNGENVLHNLAKKPKQEEIINHFFAKGVNVDQADVEGNTPFMNAAAANQDAGTVALFLDKVKNINAVNKKGASALAMAIKGNSPEIAQLLISKGANVNVVDGDGNNLAWYLIQSYAGLGGGRGQGAPAGARGPGAASGGPGAPRPDAFGAKMKLLQDAGLNLGAVQKDGNTLFHLAIAKNDVGLFKRVEKLNIDVNAKNKEGFTALQKAALVAKDDTILKYLLSIGAQKDITTEFKETAYDMAKENEFLSKNNISLEFLK